MATKRKLTTFLAHEMLYDFATDQLDAERRSAVEDFIKTDRESQVILDSIRKSLSYTSQLSATAISPVVLQYLSESENVVSLGKRYSSWREWPETLRWSLIAILISSTVAGFVSIVPWSRWSFQHKTPNDSIEIAQIEIPATDGKPAHDTQETAEAAPSAPDEGSGDDVPDAPSQPPGKHIADKPPSESTDQEPSGESGSKQVEKAATKPILIAATATENKPSSTSGAAPSLGQSNPAPVQAGAGVQKREAKAQGYVHRAFMNLGDLDTLGPKIAEQIRELGGEKAGEVELGWMRGTGRYYHFVMPESGEKQLLEKLQAYGPVRISKDPHPRVMPEGQVRFILWVEANN